MNQDQCIQDLLTKGIYIDTLYSDIVEYFDSKYFFDKEHFEFKKDYNQFFKQLDIDENIAKFFIEPIVPILNFISNTLNIRDIHAVITEPTADNLKGHASKWHTDYKNSFAMMLLVNDISVNDPHMQFVPNKKYNSALRFDSLETDIQYIDCIGNAGTYYLFNNGSYLHRGFLKGTKPRKTLHAVYI